MNITKEAARSIFNIIDRFIKEQHRVKRDRKIKDFEAKYANEAKRIVDFIATVPLKARDGIFNSYKKEDILYSLYEDALSAYDVKYKSDNTITLDRIMLVALDAKTVKDIFTKLGYAKLYAD